VLFLAVTVEKIAAWYHFHNCTQNEIAEKQAKRDTLKSDLVFFTTLQLVHLLATVPNHYTHQCCDYRLICANPTATGQVQKDDRPVAGAQAGARQESPRKVVSSTCFVEVWADRQRAVFAC
jgi:hypothetical protein